MTTAKLLAAADEALIEAGFRTGGFDEAERLARAAAASAERDEDHRGAAAAATVLGYVLHSRNIMALMSGEKPDAADVELEREHFVRGLAGFDRLRDEAGIARAAFGLGVYEQVLNEDWDAAMPYFRRAESLIPVLETAGDLYTRSEIHRHLGFYHLVEDRQTAVAVEHLKISLELREQQGEPRRIPSGLVALAWAERENGDPRRAVQLLRRAVETARELDLLPVRIADAEDALKRAEAAARETETGL